MINPRVTGCDLLGKVRLQKVELQRDDYRHVVLVNPEASTVTDVCSDTRVHKCQIIERQFDINTLYKRKKEKVTPMNKQHAGGLKPEGSENWKKELHTDGPSQPNKCPWITPKFSDIAKGSRLTPERVDKLKIGNRITAEE